MATHQSAIKKLKQDIVRRNRNRGYRSRLKNQVKKFRALLDSGEFDQARKLLPETISIVDSTARHGVIHLNAASRYKSRLTRAIERAEAGPAAS
jgi:small subunit ribosomal protein S20